MSRVVIIKGEGIRSKAQFHEAIAIALGFPDYYGRNLDALWDCMAGVKRPVTLEWIDSQVSAQAMRADFEKIVTLFREIEKRDDEEGLPSEERFHLVCR